MDEKFFFKKKHLFWLFILVCCGLVFYKIRSVLLPFYIAFFVTILFNGVVYFFEKKFRIPRVCTSGIITVMICTFLAYITYLLFQITFLKATSLSVDKFASSISRNISNHAGIIDDATMYFTILLEKYSIHDVLNIIANQCTDMAIRYTKYFIKM